MLKVFAAVNRCTDVVTSIRLTSVKSVVLKSLVFLDNKVTDEKNERKMVSTNAKITS